MSDPLHPSDSRPADTGPGGHVSGPPEPDPGHGFAERRAPRPVGVGMAGQPPGGFPPRPRSRGSRPRLLPIFLGIMLVLGFVGFSFILLMSFFMSSASRGASLSSFGLGGEKLALVRINDAIGPGATYDFWMDSLKEIGDNANIKGVILRIESPGGSVASSQEIYDEIIHLRRDCGKTVYVSMGDVAASGGYYIASAADRIFANKGTLTGSVGVISTSYQVQELAKDWGIQVEVIKSGRFKDSGSMFRPMTPDEDKMFNLLINDAYNQFIQDILAERSKQLETALTHFTDWDRFLFQEPAQPDARSFLLQIADGRVYSGEQALELGLIDEIGALNATIDRLTQDLGLPPQTKLYTPQRHVSFFQALSSKISGGLPSALTHPSLQYRMIPF